MKFPHQILLSFCAVLFSSTLVFAVNIPKAKTLPAPYKEYTLLNVQTVVSNSPQCLVIEQALNKLSEHPLQLQFIQRTTPGHLEMKERGKATTKHRYIIVEQDVKGHALDRTGIGQFNMDSQVINYVIKISADADQANFNYLYPMILSGDTGHCFYTAMLKPNAETIEMFKKNIRNGLAAQGADLSAK